MLNPILVEDEDVIQIYDHKIIDEWLYDVIHYPRENCWSISQTKSHENIIENIFSRLEGCILDIGFLNWDLVVYELHINIVEIHPPAN